MSKRPNLIYVFADELGYQHCGLAGNRVARTAHIDALAASGMNFRQAVSATPVCAAYRISLFTGKYTTSTGMVINEIRANPNQRCIGHVLTENGYETAYIGKWHLWSNRLGGHEVAKNGCIPPGPYRLGFDGFWAAYNFNHDYYGSSYCGDACVKMPWGGEGVYEPDAQTDMAIDRIRRHVAGKGGGADKPLAMFLSIGTPHDPWTWDNVPKQYGDMFRHVKFSLPGNYSELDDPYADQWGRFKPGMRERILESLAIYYAMVANLDDNIGRLVRAIDEAGIGEETLLVFTSDHGEMFGSHGRRGKNIFYEEAIRVPFLMRRPGMIPAGVSDVLLNTPDIMPTVLGLLGLPIPESVEGMDLSRCALGRPGGGEPEVALLQNTGACADWIDGHEWRAMRDERYTYAIFRRDGSERLFDRSSDPLQMKNLAGEAFALPVLEKFRGMLKTKMAELNDTFEACTWYRDHWTKDRVVLRGARG
ncbi:MAG: sulfatase [Phycisphaerales bacterium]|nr:sulfatase [Phycisphaerales bacterium]